MLILTAGDALFRDILLHPEEDSYRLIYADWLEDNGQTSEARYIREGVAVPWRTYIYPDKVESKVNLLWGITKYHQARGFVYKIELPLSDFMKLAEALFTRHPITKVVLTDRVPYPMTDYEEGTGDHEYPGWSKEGDWSLDEPETSSKIGEQLFDLLTPKRKYNKGWADYDSVKEAREALSNACVTYGRKFLV